MKIPGNEGSDTATYEAGDLRVEPGIRRVTRGGQEIALPGLTFDLLMALIGGAPNLLSPERLMQEVWKGQIVSPETLTQRVKLLRDALGDDSQNPRYVAGTRGQGYRLLVPVRRMEPEKRIEGAPAQRIPWFMAAAIASVLVVVGVVIFVDRSGDRVAAETYRSDSIAVLPFENRSPREEDAHFAAGIHDDLLTRLSRMPRLRVIARGSVADLGGTGESIPQIGRQLGVDTILRGAVQRAGDSVRVQVQMFDAVRNQQLWAETYDRSLTVENVFAIQSEISHAIATKLQIAMSPADRERVERRLTSSLPAYESWLKGRQEMERYTPEGLAAAVLHFQEAIAADAEFAQAHVGLAEARLLQRRFRTLGRDEALSLAESSIERALVLDPGSAEAFAVKGDVLRLQGRLETAEAALQRAIALNPNLAVAFISYGWLLMEQGRTVEQMEMWRRAGLLDPRSPVAGVHRAFTELRRGRRDEAEAQLREVLQRHPAFPLAHVILGEARVAAGDQATAIVHYRRALELNPALPLAQAGLATALIDLEMDAEAAEAVRGLRKIETADGIRFELLLASLAGESGRSARLVEELRARDAVSGAHAAALDHLRHGRVGEALAELEAAEPRLRDASSDPLDGRTRFLSCTYADALLRSGSRRRGEEIARGALKRLDSDVESTRSRLAEKIVCHAVLGETEAIAALLRSGGVPVGWRAALARPELGSLRSHPSIVEVVEVVRTEAARQASRTLSLSAGRVARSDE